MENLRCMMLVGLFSMLYLTGFSQVTSIPEQAKENFGRQYPNAQRANWNNDIINVKVKFELDGERMNAEYNNKGIWKSTAKEWTYDKLPDDVKDGFKKSKYADRNVKEVKVIYYPGDVIRYRLRVEKNDFEKKYLYFNASGRLMRESITI